MDQEGNCLLDKVRPESELDKPRCHCCGTQTAEHSGYCSVCGPPGYRAMPFSEKEQELDGWVHRK